MKNKFSRQFFKLAATVLVCAIVSIGNLPTTMSPAAGNTGNGLKLENQGNGEGDEEPGISPQNDKEEFNNDTLD